MSSLMFAEIAATCNALGYSNEDKYYIDDQCEEAVKDLIRYLRRDDENHEIRRYLGEAKILQTDLVPILKECHEKKELFDHVLRLLVNLTYPALVLYRAELPAEKTSRYYYLQIISHLQAYKEAFVDEQLWAILCRRLGELLKIEWQDRSEDESKAIEIVLTLIRNVLQVPADTDSEKRPDNDANIHDQVLWALYQSGMVGLFHYIAGSEHEDKYYMHILEIISLMLRDQNPAFLAQAAVHRSMAEKDRDEEALVILRNRESNLRNEKVRKYTAARFTGTYVVKDVKSISNEDMIYHKPLNSLTALDFNRDKNKVKKPKNRAPMQGDIIERRSTVSVRLFLKEFCIEFLNGAYNTLMYKVRELIHRGQSQTNDESFYLWAMKFFMEFNRHYKSEMKLVSETMSLSIFHFIQTQIENLYEQMVVDKKKIFLWSRRMHLALRAYQELLMTLMTMDQSSDPGVRESARVIKSNIFYVVEYRELILTLTINFDEMKFTRAYLKDLIETVHIFMKLLEKFCNRSRGIVVQQKQKTKRTKDKKKNITARPENVVAPEPEELWENFEPEITSVVETISDVPDGVIPFDSASEVPIEDQKVDAVKKIQAALREKQFETALGLLRASREVWPENDSFGAPNPAPEEELIALKEIFLADLGVPFVTQQPAPANEHEEEEEEENEEEEDSDDGGREISTSFAEKTFQFLDFAKRFCHARVVQACTLLLRQFEQNSVHTNHCALKLLHRIAWDCKLPSMLFQASVFRTFQRIMDSRDPHHKELIKFAVFIVRKFVEVARINPKAYMELLFWKSSKDAYDIENGYGSYLEQSHSSKQAWTEEEEFELRRLYEEYMGNPERLPEGEGDMVEWIMKNLINDSRSRRGVVKKLKDMGCAVPTKPSRKPVSTRPPFEWSTAEEEELTALFNEFREANDPLGCILDRLTVRRPKPRVVEKLLDMGLVQNKKELYKKRSKKNQNPGNARRGSLADDSGASSEGEINSEDEVDSGGSSDDNTTPSVRRPATNQRPRPKGPGKSNRNRQPPKQRKLTKFNREESIRLLQQVKSAGMTEALTWLSESLSEAADDYDPNDTEPVPLLPLSEACILAMDSPLFQQFLRAMGISEPADEQEAYWRIPGTFNAEDLRSCRDVIEMPEADFPVNTEDLLQDVSNMCQRMLSENVETSDSDEDNDENENPEQSVLSLNVSSMTNFNERSALTSSFEDLSQSSQISTLRNGSVTSSSKSNAKKAKKSYGRGKMNTVADSSSESDSENTGNRRETTSSNEIFDQLRAKSLLQSDSEDKNSKRKKRKKIVSHSSSESGSETNTFSEAPHLTEDNTEECSTKRVFDSDSDAENLPEKKKPKIFFNDDEDE